MDAWELLCNFAFTKPCIATQSGFTWSVNAKNDSSLGAEPQSDATLMQNLSKCGPEYGIKDS